MSTIKSSNEDITINADGSGRSVKFQANGVEKASIDSSGNFTSTSIDATKLSGTVPNFTSTGIDDNATSTAITIDSGEKVGIGTSSPSANLHISSSGDTIARITSADGNGAFLDLGDASDPDGGRIVYDSGSNLGFSTASTERMRIDSSGNVGIGTSSPGAKLDIVPSSTARIIETTSYSTAHQYHHVFQNSSGSLVGTITVTPTSTSYTTSSDYRLKENVVPMSASIDRLKELKPSRFNFIADADKTVDGFLAHEAQEVVPEAVSGEKDAMRTEEYEVEPAVEATYDDDGNELTPAVEAVMGTREVPDYQGIDQSKLTPLIVGALQEAIEKIESLEAEIALLKGA